jgi:hypothetical protein
LYHGFSTAELHRTLQAVRQIEENAVQHQMETQHKQEEDRPTVNESTI